MNVLVRGNHANIIEFSSKFPGMAFDQDLMYSSDMEIGKYEVIFDFLIDESPENLDVYMGYRDLILFANSVNSTLLEYATFLEHDLPFSIIGFNGMPSFFNRDLLELTLLDDTAESKVKEVAAQLEFEYEIVEDRVGMVTPRVVCMIINEAYFTVQEGTADKAAIDEAMKLGTSYPYGPFEWAKKIGIGYVYELLDALYNDTHDERYKMSALLKKEYLLGQ